MSQIIRERVLIQYRTFKAYNTMTLYVYPHQTGITNIRIIHVYVYGVCVHVKQLLRHM